MEYVNKTNLSVLGMGTTVFWNGNARNAENCILKAVSDFGLSTIDTAEMYGYGRCEEAVGRILKKVGRDHIYLIDKILPSHIGSHFEKSLNQSLKRLGTDYIDMYLLHWRENADLQAVCDQMNDAVQKGKILKWGVSNFDVDDLKDLLSCQGGTHCYTDQVFYNIFERGIEVELLPFMKKHHILPMSYSSLGSSYVSHPNIRNNGVIMDLCEREHTAPEAVMLRNNLEHGVVSLFSTSSLSHMKANMTAFDLNFAAFQKALDECYPAPVKKYPLVKI